MSSDSKLCLECGKPIPERATKYGPKPRICSDACSKVRGSKRCKAWKAKNRALVVARDVEYRRKFKRDNPDYFKQFYAQHRDRRQAEAKAWYEANKERAIARQAAYHAKRKQERPEYIRAIVLQACHRRLAKQRKAFVEDVNPLTVFERDKGICGICRKPVERASRWEIDHVYPVSRGGLHSYANVQLAHRACNRAKSASLPNEQSVAT